MGSDENDNVVIFSVYITTLQMERMGTVADLDTKWKIFNKFIVLTLQSLSHNHCLFEVLSYSFITWRY